MTDTADDEAARLKAVHNEQAKVSATYLNGLAVAVAAVGGLSPVFSGRYSSADPGQIAIGGLNLLVCLIASGLLHFAARTALKGIR